MRSGRLSVQIACGGFLVITILYMGVFLGGTGQGNLDWHVLPSDRFPIPKKLSERGFEPLWKNGVSGFDGQFYFYIANDLLGTTDTVNSIDLPAYRYQRIGLPLLSNLISKIFWQDWVSSFTYYATNLLVAALGVFFLAAFFEKRGYSPYLAWTWGLAFGTQVSLMNGLQDAFADSMLILALIAYVEKRLFWMATAATLACLGREIYILLPFFVGMDALIRLFHLRKRPDLGELCWQRLAWVVFVGAIWAGWQIYLLHHFKAVGILQVKGAVSPPLVELSKHAVEYYSKFVSVHHLEFIYLVYFILTIIISVFIILLILMSAHLNVYLPVLLFFLSLALLYTSLGRAVLAYRIHFMRPISLILIFIPFIFAWQGKKIPRAVVGFLILSFVFHNASTMKKAWATETKDYFSMYHSREHLSKQLPAIENTQSHIDLMSIETFYHNALWRRWLARPETHIYRVQISNLGDRSYPRIQGDGAIHISYYLTEPQSGAVVYEGFLTTIQKELQPGQSLQMPMIVEYPNLNGRYEITLSLVQTFSSAKASRWFHTAKSPEKLTLNVQLHGREEIMPDTIIKKNTKTN